MRYLNLSDDFIIEPAINREIIRFPSGFETTIRLKDSLPEEVTIVARIESSTDIFLIGQAVDILRRGKFCYVEQSPFLPEGETKVNCKKINLFLPFVPNARQDRRMVNGDAFGLKVFANYINSFNFNRVLVFDPHSSVTPALINNCEVIPQEEFAVLVLQQDPRNWILCSPDIGAAKKTDAVAKAIYESWGNEGYPTIVLANKKRNPQTGNIDTIDIYGDVKDQIVYILDDICDGGATFILLTKRLKELGASEVNLVVSHGIFSKGLTPLLKAGICHIYTTNSFNHTQNLFGEDQEARKWLRVTDIRPLLRSYL